MSSKLSTYKNPSKNSAAILTQTISQFPIPAIILSYYHTLEPLRTLQNNDFTAYAHSELGKFWDDRLIE
jgi:hypothetical protein